MRRTPRPAFLLVAMLALASLSAAPPQKVGDKPSPEPAAAPQPASHPTPPAAQKPPARPTGPIANPIAITVQVIPSVATSYVNSLGFPQPNPVTWATVIHYSLAKGGSVSVKLYSITGQEAATLVDGYHSPGNYSLWWDGTGNHGRLAPGVYIYRMVSGSFVRSRRLVLVR